MKTGAVKIRNIRSIGFRTDASYHLSEGQEVKRLINASPYPMLQIKDVTSDIFIGNRARRVYVTDRKHGIPFLSSSDILQADLENVKLASAKYTPQVEQMKLQKGWTLISRSGTIGNCAFANAQHAQKLASEDVIRTCPNNILRAGLLYAYLASKYGHSLLTQGTFGAVIQHIEPDFVGSLPIPHFPDDFQKKIDDLIQESARLREEAAEEIAKARKEIDSIFSQKHISSKSKSVRMQTIANAFYKRFEGSYYISEGADIQKLIEERGNYVLLKDVSEKIFRPGIFKRQYVQKGVMFLGGADIMAASPKSEKFLPMSQVSKMPELFVKDGWILITCGGTIGNAVFVDKELAKCTISQHVMRIVPKGIASGYLYAFLTSEIGKKSVLRSSFGSVIPQMEPAHFGQIRIPLMDDTKMNEIATLAESYKAKNERAKCIEADAILMVENEIESWQN